MDNIGKRQSALDTQKFSAYKHILIECVDFNETINEFYTTDTLKELFEKVPSNKILDYVKTIGIYNLI